MIKIAFYGKSGSGKSTIASLANEYFALEKMSVQIIKFAEPLYYIQSIFYERSGMQIEKYDQNQNLMEDIARWMRTLNPESLVLQFNNCLRQADVDVIINDDVRDTKMDFPFLKNQGFYLFRICCDEKLRLKRLQQRNDLSTVLNSSTTNLIDTVCPDYVIDTSEDDIKKTNNYLVSCIKEVMNKERLQVK